MPNDHDEGVRGGGGGLLAAFSTETAVEATELGTDVGAGTGTSAVSVGRFGGAAQGAGPLLTGQGRLRRRCASALRAPLTCEPLRPLGQSMRAGRGPARSGCAAPPNLGCSGGRR